MKLIRSNRTENLADALASLVRDEPLGPFQKEVVVVQNRGTETWLTLALAKRLGIWSNPSFPFPRSVIENVLERTVEQSEKAAGYAPARLKWTIARLLQESAPEGFAEYLGTSANPDRVLRLADSIASVFDDYVVFRPKLLRQWAKSEDGDWQGHLWRRVAKELGPYDLATRIEDALPKLSAGIPREELPFCRLHLFALETLPPLFLEFFSGLSRSVQTTLYVLEPSSEYLGDVDVSGGEPALTDGHTFVSDVGRLSRDFQQVLLSVDEVVEERVELFEAPEPTDLLKALQADIVEFRSPPRPEDRLLVDASDRSISLHECAGPMREVQVIHELVRDALESDATLEPEDVIVLSPNLDTYAPLFRAVFGENEAHRIPYEVHDRLSRDDASIYEDFTAVLEVLDSRFSVFDLVRLMDAGAMREDFRFTPDERARLTELLAASGIRWGIDAEHRAQLDFPAEALHTWRAGLGRLFLGFANVPGTTEVFEGLLPRGGLSLGDAELVARLSRLCEVLFEYHGRTRQALPLGEWAALLGHLCTSLFAEDDESSQAVRTIREALVALQTLGEQSGYADAISLKALRREVAGQLRDATPAVGFMRRGVTFAELVPRRSIPFRLVCLVGMNEESFPRADKRPSFDETRKNPLPGDRNQRQEDRLAFLQAILCARGRLIMTYGAASTGSRGEANPSPLVWELCESVNRYYRRADEERLLEPTVQPLHAFDARYFDGSAIPQSSSKRNHRIAETLAEPSVEHAAVELRAELAELDSVLSVDELSHWLWDPTKTFVERVLLARFERSGLYEPTSAVTKISSLDASKVGNSVLRAGLRGSAMEGLLAAAPEFPDGTPGTLQVRALAREIEALNVRASSLRSESAASSGLLSLNLGDLSLEGRIDGLSPDQRLVERFTKTEGRVELTTWIEHLLAQAATGTRRTSHLVLRGTNARATLVSFSAVEDPARLLDELVGVYRNCLEAPLPLLGKASRIFANRFAEDASEDALKAARTELKHLLKHDLYLAYLFGSDDPFQDEDWTDTFQEAALALYGAFFEHWSES